MSDMPRAPEGRRETVIHALRGLVGPLDEILVVMKRTTALIAGAQRLLAGMAFLSTATLVVLVGTAVYLGKQARRLTELEAKLDRLATNVDEVGTTTKATQTRVSETERKIEAASEAAPKIEVREKPDGGPQTAVLVIEPTKGIESKEMPAPPQAVEIPLALPKAVRRAAPPDH